MEFKVGEIYEAARVVEIKDFGAVVEITPFHTGLIYFTQIVPSVEHGKIGTVLSVGDKVKCAISEIN